MAASKGVMGRKVGAGGEAASVLAGLLGLGQGILDMVQRSRLSAKELRGVVDRLEVAMALQDTLLFRRCVLELVASVGESGAAREEVVGILAASRGGVGGPGGVVDGAIQALGGVQTAPRLGEQAVKSNRRRAGGVARDSDDDRGRGRDREDDDGEEQRGGGGRGGRSGRGGRGSEGSGRGGSDGWD